MTANLVLGPLLRYAGSSDATVWVETDAACEVGIMVDGSTHRSRTFHIDGHHYALVRITGLRPGSSYEYAVGLDGEQVWPEPAYDFPPPSIRTIAPDGDLTLSFGSCRVSVPHEPPYTLPRDKDRRGYERDALYALALRMLRESRDTWPDALLLLGDQVYADEVSPGALEFIRSRRSPNEPPGEEVANFEEYTRLYWDSWKDPTVRWLLSTVPSAMIFDDHDVHDDWNTSETWVRQMRARPWWEERIVGAFMSYWLYQHLGNLSPKELETNDLYCEAREARDAGSTIRRFAFRAAREAKGTRWSYHRDFGRVRLIVVDSRAGRVLEENRRSMLDSEEWSWIEDGATGDFDHLLFGTSLPLLIGPGLHHLEAASEAVCRGAWGGAAARHGEILRQSLDLEHWAAFHDSFERFVELLRSVASGERAPRSVTVLSGDVHHSYLAEVRLGDGATSAVHQAVCSPYRNELEPNKRRIFEAGWSRAGMLAGRLLARSAGVRHPDVEWSLVHDGVWFDNQIGLLDLDGDEARLGFERALSKGSGEPRLEEVFGHRLV